MIRVVIAEDKRMLGGALASLLELEDDTEVVGQAVNGEEALKLIHDLLPDVCLLDIEMPVMSGLEVTERVMAEQLPCKVVILTTFARPGYFERAVAAGVQGYLLKDEPSEKLASALRQIMKGRQEFSPELVFGAFKQGNPLKVREQEILKLAAAGKTNTEIANTLHLSHGTVRNYISEVLSKLEAKNRMEAIRISEERGWLS